MDDLKMKAMIQRVFQTSLSGIRGDPRLAQRVLHAAHEKGEKEMKKFSVGFALTLVLVLAFASLAGALTMNLFESFGQQQRRLFEIAAESEIRSPAPATIHSEQWGESTITITNAYYDGDALLIGYAIENANRTVRFAPTDEQRAKMTALSEAFDSARIEDQAMQEAYIEAKRSGSAFGVVKSSVALSPDWYAEDNISLGSWNQMDDLLSDGTRSFVRDFDNLPKALRHLERMTVHMNVNRNLSYIYFDGENTYTMEEQVTLSPIELCVEAAEGELYYFDGEADSDAYTSIVATASDVRLTVQITAADRRFAEISDELWYDMRLADEAGNLYEAVSSEMLDGNTLFFTFNGCGKAPKTLTGHLLLIGDADGTESIAINFRKRGD